MPQEKYCFNLQCNQRQLILTSLSERGVSAQQEQDVVLLEKILFLFTVWTGSQFDLDKSFSQKSVFESVE